VPGLHAAMERSGAMGGVRAIDPLMLHFYKFDCVGQPFLLAYEYDPLSQVLLLVGTHENFYRLLKR
jgi:hypothetical protein